MIKVVVVVRKKEVAMVIGRVHKLKWLGGSLFAGVDRDLNGVEDACLKWMWR